MIAIDVRCVGEPATGWSCGVTLSDGGRTVSVHQVAVASGDLHRLARGASDPTDLVRRSFEFLLQREPPSSILRSFELPAIGRYFPEYDGEIRHGTRDLL